MTHEEAPEAAGDDAGPGRTRRWRGGRGLWARERNDVLARVYRVAVVARSLLGAHAILVNFWLVWPRAEHPWLVALANAVIVGWTVAVSSWLAGPSRRSLYIHVADAAVTVGLVLLTLVALPHGGAPLSLAGYWISGAPMYAAIFQSTRAGVLSAVAVGIALFMVPSQASMERAGMTFVVILVAWCSGLLIEQFRATITEQEQERIRVAALAERERLSRIVHDGALQVLALVEREGPLLGPVGVRLAALARESESQLRVHLQDRDIHEPRPDAAVDLAAALDKYSSARVTVSTMAGEVLASRYVVEEIESTVQEILKNVDRHAGPDARCWLLLDQEVDDEAIVFIRDNGVGMDAAQARRAAEQGRFGIRDSIIGRIAAIGGSAILKSAPGAGTEWELRIPLDAE